MLFATDAGRARDVVVDPAGVRGPRRCRSRWPMSSCSVDAQPVHAVVRSSATIPANYRNFLAHHRSGTRPPRRSGSWAAFVDEPTQPSWTLGARGRHRIDRPDRRFLGAGPRPVDDRRLGRRRRHIAERCGLFVIIALGESILITGATFADLAWTRDDRCRLRGLVRRQRRDVDGLLQHRRRAFEPRDRVVRRSGRAGAQRLHLHAHPDRRRHHRRGRRRRARAAPSRRPRRPHRHGDGRWRSSAARRSIWSATRCSNGCRHPICRCRIWSGSACLALLAPAAAITTPLVLSAGTTAILIVVAAWEWLSLGHGSAADDHAALIKFKAPNDRHGGWSRSCWATIAK